MLLFSVLLLSACLPEPPTPTPEPPTATATVTPTTTATIVWFPATATYTPMPTIQVTPTVDLSPSYGSLMLEDGFTDKSLWQTFRTAVGSVAYGKGELTLAVSEARGTLASLRKGPQMDNFYLEIDAAPSLCRGGDAYGVLLRAASSQDYYRLALNCNGQVRLERLKNSRSLALQDWLGSGQILPGAMAPARIGVWATGEELRVYVNSVYQFTVKDPVFTMGTVGVFARSAGDTPLTVSFSNLSVYRVQGSTIVPLPAPTATRTPTVRPTTTSTRTAVPLTATRTVTKTAVPPTATQTKPPTPTATRKTP